MLMPLPVTREEGLTAANTAASVSAAAPARVPAIARFLPSLTDVAFLMPVLFLFVKLSGARTLLADGDTGWHLRTGEWILSHHQIPHTDLFSFSRPGAPWFAWEWLWDTIFALLFRSGGMAAVVLASTLVICLASVAMFRLIRRKCDNGLVAIAVTLLATGGCSIHWLARPHLFTILFFVLTLHITQRADEGRTKLLGWLIPLTLVWTNLHGGFFVVFLVLACYIGGHLLNAFVEADPARSREYLSKTLPWLKTFAACFAVTFINPYGWQLHRHIATYVADPYLLQHIGEFQGLDFHSPATVYFEPLIIGALASSFWALRQRRFAEALLTLGWTHLALIAVRNLPLFSIAASPLIAEGIVTAIRAAATSPLREWLAKTADWFRAASSSVDTTDRIGRVYLTSAAAMGLLALLLFAPKPPADRFVSEFDPTIFPAGAIPVLRSSATHRIWAQDQWGDYLIYRMYPSTKVFIDGRSDFYGDKFGEEYLRLLDVQVGWDKTLDRYGIDTVVVSPKLALSSALKVSQDWRVVFDDHNSVVFRRNRPVQSSFASDSGEGHRDPVVTKSTGSSDHGNS
ncbi:MAG TPA: hypothetical protein VHC90_23710 [Bryobacteraceae bacterium]|nr:hypothetical protein [Bryobacteraceae bacterium]